MGIPCSVNKGIDKDKFKQMSSTPLWLKSLRQGRVGTLLSKMDWEQVYKHVHVNNEQELLKAAGVLFLQQVARAIKIVAMSRAGSKPPINPPTSPPINNS